MGARGPEGKTKTELEASGSWRSKDKVDLERPIADKGQSEPPEQLTESERKIWFKYLPIVTALRTYGSGDETKLAQLCRAENELWEIQAEILKRGVCQEVEIVSGKGENKRIKTILRKSPLIDIEKHAIRKHELYSMKFGLDQHARTRLQIVPYAQKPNNSDNRPPNASDEKSRRVSGMMD